MKINPQVQESRFLKTCRGETTDCKPIWLMRQAGRYMPNYRELRSKHTMLEVIQSPSLSAEVTMQPIEAFDLDAAIIFSDILPPLIGLGLDLDFVKGEGPCISNPIASPEQVEMLPATDVADNMGPTLEAISLVSNELNSRGIPLIGFAGAPFTLACYAIQGSGSKMYEKAKAFMYSYPDAWDTLMTRLSDIVSDLLTLQARHGASALQLFDSWAGVLSRTDYVKFIQPYNKRIFDRLAPLDLPVINFSTGTGTHLDEVSRCGGSVVGVDWRVPIDASLNDLQPGQAIQGNLDPTCLLSSWDVVKNQADAILKVAPQTGHIFNLGHGILPPTPMENVQKLVDHVHESTS